MAIAEPAFGRRVFLGVPLLAVAAVEPPARARARINLAQVERGRVLKAARQYLREQPITVTAATSPRSAGGPHDYFSEGDYWWPDPKNPQGPYIQRDGQSNPDNFDDHRKAMRRLSVQVPALTAAWVLTKQRRYGEQATAHLRAWFVDEATHMSPHLKYSQAIKGKATGRSIGVIDTIHLVEVARAADVLERTGVLAGADREGVRRWFKDYLAWITTHEYGTTERDAKNNHGTCWVMQAAEFARYLGDAAVSTDCRDRVKKIIIPNQLAADGSFPQELRRTKPYGYSLFNIDILASCCQILSTAEDNLWTFQLPDGRGMGKALEFIYPFILDKKKWPHKPDVMYWDEWPMRHPSLLFGGLALDRPEYLSLWKKLPADSKVDEVIRNFPVRQPVLWVDPPAART
jgi:hypothetical protein